jgi:hypothetical protein
LDHFRAHRGIAADLADIARDLTVAPLQAALKAVFLARVAGYFGIWMILILAERRALAALPFA